MKISGIGPWDFIFGSHATQILFCMRFLRGWGRNNRLTQFAVFEKGTFETSCCCVRETFLVTSELIYRFKVGPMNYSIVSFFLGITPVRIYLNHARR